jgi:hypothetical protein
MRCNGRERRASITAILLCSLVCACHDRGVVEPASAPVLPISQQLSVSAVFQQTPEWCWAASLQMVAQYYGLPDGNPAGTYQCGIVALTAAPGSACALNCATCQTEGGGTMTMVQQTLNQYGVALNQLGMSSPVLTDTLVFRALTEAEVQSEIGLGRPIIAGVSIDGEPAGPNSSGHVVVIIGYDFTSAVHTVTVNDPWPYDGYLAPNPYLIDGTETGPAQYVVPSASMPTHLHWANTIYQIRPR